MHSINSTKRAQGARKDSVQPGTTPVPHNKLQQVVRGGNNQAAEPCPEDSEVASSAPKDAVEYTLDAEAEQELKTTKHTKQLSYHHRKVNHTNL